MKIGGFHLHVEWDIIQFYFQGHKPSPRPSNDLETTLFNTIHRDNVNCVVSHIFGVGYYIILFSSSQEIHLDLK